MRWKYLLLFCLLLLILVPSFSQEKPVSEMTDSEIIAQLMQNLENSEKLLKEKEAILTEKENSLKKREESLSQREASLIIIESYWKSLKSDIQGEFWRGFFWGSITGFIGGGAVGLSFNIQLQ